MPILGLLWLLELVRFALKTLSTLVTNGETLGKKLTRRLLYVFLRPRKLLPTWLAHWRYIIYSSWGSRLFLRMGVFSSGSSFHRTLLSPS